MIMVIICGAHFLNTEEFCNCQKMHLVVRKKIKLQNIINSFTYSTYLLQRFFLVVCCFPFTCDLLWSSWGNIFFYVNLIFMHLLSFVDRFISVDGIMLEFISFYTGYNQELFCEWRVYLWFDCGFKNTFLIKFWLHILMVSFFFYSWQISFQWFGTRFIVC